MFLEISIHILGWIIYNIEQSWIPSFTLSNEDAVIVLFKLSIFSKAPRSRISFTCKYISLILEHAYKIPNFSHFQALQEETASKLA